MTGRQWSRRRAFTLLEVAAVLAILSVLMLLLTAALVGAFRIEELAAGSYNRLIRQEVVADQFRDDVAAASAAPKERAKDRAGPDCLLLTRPDGGQVVYRWEDESLVRTEVIGGKETAHALPVGSGVTVAFARSADDRLLTLRLSEARGPRKVKQIVDVTAALGGDLR